MSRSRRSTGSNPRAPRCDWIVTGDFSQGSGQQWPRLGLRDLEWGRVMGARPGDCLEAFSRLGEEVVVGAVEQLRGFE